MLSIVFGRFYGVILESVDSLLNGLYISEMSVIVIFSSLVTPASYFLAFFFLGVSPFGERERLWLLGL